MRNLIIFLSTFTLTVLLAVFMSKPANALTIPAVDGECLAGWTLNSEGSCTSNSTGGAGGSWGCPEGWSTKPDGTCSFDGAGGGTGGGGGGGSWEQTCGFAFGNPVHGTGIYPTTAELCQSLVGYRNAMGKTVTSASVKSGQCVGAFSGGGSIAVGMKGDTCDEPPEPPEPEEPPNPDFPDIPPPTPDCNVCQSLYEIKLKLNVLKNYDIKIINQSILDMSQVINNIDNSIGDLNVSNTQINTNIENINNSITNLVTNIENNNITQNEIKNEVNNIKNVMNDYSLQLGDIKLAMGDIDVKLDNTNKLVLDLGLDIEWIKNNLVNGSPEGKDYTEQLNQIIDLLKPCQPTAEKPCPDDDAVVKKLKEIQDFMEADFEPGTDSTAVEVEDLTDIELDRNLIKFGVAQCPPDNEFSTMVNGFSFSGGFKHKPLCDFFTLLSPFIKAFGGFSAALILGGGLRRG